jgi:uncharacterized protein (TIGR02118 family)
MFTVIVQIKKPKDKATFEEHFWKVHLPIVKIIPGVRRITVHRVLEIHGGDPDLYGMVELCFDDQPSFDRAKSSPEMKTAFEDGSRLEVEAETVMSFDYYCDTMEVT